MKRLGVVASIVAFLASVVVVVIVRGEKDVAGRSQQVCVVAVDRTSIAARASWAGEVAQATDRFLGDELATCTEVLLIAAGHSVDDAVIVAREEIPADCRGDAYQCLAQSRGLRTAVTDRATQLASESLGDPDGYGTDLVVSLVSIAGAVGDHTGVVLLLSDGLDARIAGDEPIQDLVGEALDHLPVLQSLRVTMVGVGANASPYRAERARIFWELLFDAAGADARVLRSY